jgi:hypothetical protein
MFWTKSNKQTKSIQGNGQIIFILKQIITLIRDKNKIGENLQ